MKKNISLILILVCLSTFILTGCQDNPNPSDTSCPYEKFITVDVYDTLANYQGIQSGWFAKIIKDKFNMELNIIAPNTTGNGETLYKARFAAGDIGDLIICSSTNGKLEEMHDAELIIDMKPYLQNSNLLKKYSESINFTNSILDDSGIYAIPSSISTKSPYSPCEVSAPLYGSYLRWDSYSAIGCPDIPTLEDLLPVLEKMHEATPYSESGNPTYAFSFFKDWDGNLMNAIKQPCCFYGYDEYGFVLAKADGTNFQDILDDTSFYMRVLKFYFNANQMGLVDPESVTQTYNDTYNKFADGQVLFAPWPWISQSAFNTNDHLNDGKAYMFVPIDDESIYSYGNKNTGDNRAVICIGCQAEDPARLADFVDWIYSPEGVNNVCVGQSQSTAGPEGLTWEMTDHGPELTELGVDILINGKQKLPEEWGNNTWLEGIPELNFAPLCANEDMGNGYMYYYETWDSVRKLRQTKVDIEWAEKYNANTVMEYLTNNDQLSVSPGINYISENETTELSTIRNQCAALITEYSWKMVFASSEDEFNSLKETLTSRAMALGYEQVYKFDIKNAKAAAAEKKGGNN